MVKTHTKVIELTTNYGNSRISIVPELQGRILTSSFNGIDGISNGWINKKESLINLQNIGGEERLWLGPLGGQYSFYYQNINPLDENNWKVPDAIANGEFEITNKNETSVTMTKGMKLINHLGTTFNLKINRKISILDKSEIKNKLSINFDESIKHVAYKTTHSLVNKGLSSWYKQTGLVSLWSANMFVGTDNTTVIIPLKKASSLDSIYKYMGDLDANRLQIKNSNILLFKADGKYRSKIGIPKSLAPSVYGCYTKDKKRLTIVQYLETNDSLYANSYVTKQKTPYKGEVIPIYNDGPMDYSPTNKHSFFELESTSSMRELQPKTDTLKHWHSVYHFSGDEHKLNELSKTLLGIDLKDCYLD
ncbi:hypothetical protein GCM10023314_06350 [Algibacter agarivorans]|uniref:Uncharacterized protein n=1 Tax=Algibacter agarivorans TaxID=1109741 RepID=A0ABP9GBH2_9FLAO